MPLGPSTTVRLTPNNIMVYITNSKGIQHLVVRAIPHILDHPSNIYMNVFVVNTRIFRSFGGWEVSLSKES